MRGHHFLRPERARARRHPPWPCRLAESPRRCPRSPRREPRPCRGGWNRLPWSYAAHVYVPCLIGFRPSSLISIWMQIPLAMARSRPHRFWYGSLLLRPPCGRADIQTRPSQLANGARPDLRDTHHRTAIHHSLRHPRMLWLCEGTLRKERMREYLVRAHTYTRCQSIY